MFVLYLSCENNENRVIPNYLKCLSTWIKLLQYQNLPLSSNCLFDTWFVVWCPLFYLLNTMDLFCRKRWRLFRSKCLAVLLMTNRKNYAANVLHHSIHVWLMGQTSCSSPSTKEFHAWTSLASRTIIAENNFGYSQCDQKKIAKCLQKLPKNDFTRKFKDFDIFTKIA